MNFSQCFCCKKKDITSCLDSEKFLNHFCPELSEHFEIFDRRNLCSFCCFQLSTCIETTIKHSVFTSTIEKSLKVK